MAQSSADVAREWLAANGHPEVAGKRGRIKRDLLDKFDAAHPDGIYKPGASRAPATAEVKTSRTLSSGKKVPVRKTVVVSEARAAAVDAGVPVNSTGKVPNKVLEAYAIGGTAMADLAATYKV